MSNELTDVCKFTGGHLTPSMIQQRLVCLQSVNFQKDVQAGVWSNIENVLRFGCVGYFTISPETALEEWSRVQDQFYELYKERPLPIALAEDDPLYGPCQV